MALPLAGGCEAVRRYRDTTQLLSVLLTPTQQWGPNQYQACHTPSPTLDQTPLGP